MGYAHSFLFALFLTRMYNTLTSVMSKVLAVDLDGTLFYPKKITRCISRRNVKFLRNWIDAGNRLVLVTSRSHEFTNRLEKEIQRPYDVINCTSSMIFHNGEMIYETHMRNDQITKIIEEIKERYKPRAFLLTSKDQPCAIYDAGSNTWLMKISYRLWYFFQFRYKEPMVMDNDVFQHELEHGDVYKIMTFFGFGKKKGVLSKEINKELREKFPEIESSWSIIVNELTPKDCHKGAGLERYCHLLNIPNEDVYVVGDSGNDISMFMKFHEHSYCMMHAYPSVKKYARHVITRVYKLEKLVLKGE